MEKVNIIFEYASGEKIELSVPKGISLLEAAHSNGVELEGACEGSLACSTCHVILEQKHYDILLEKAPASEDEEDMLDLAFGLTSTSRLGCQVNVTQDLEGAVIKIPSATRNK